MFSTAECAWHQTSIKLLGRTIVGVTGFEFKKAHEKEYLHAAGAEPIDIQSGNKTYPGTLTVLKYELDLLNDAARAAGFEDITEVPHESVVVTCLYKKKPTDPTRTVTVAGVSFTDITLAMQQNAKNTQVPLPFLSMKTSML